jgi:membrane fusion protein, multidrug efflux system
MMQPRVGERRRQASWMAWSGILAAAAVMLTAGCDRGTQSATAAPADGRHGGNGPAAVAVSAAAAVMKPMAVKLKSVGNVEASSTVEVRAQVTGELLTVNFTEGQDVRAGQLLFTIDPRVFDAALAQAEAALARDVAQSKNLEAQHGRLTNLLKQGLVSQADYDSAAAAAAAIQASIASDKAAVDNARLQQQYTRISAPVAGRTGALLVHPGSIIRASDPAPLVVINRLVPAYVSFSVPARMLPQLRPRDSQRGLGVEASPAGTADVVSSGTVTFMDNAVDPSTDTIRLKATFANENKRLWPGAFVDVTLQISVDPKAIVIPSKAVQASQQGEFVFVVKTDQTVEARSVKVAWTEGDEAVIASGIKAGETVVTDGQLRLTPGARVSIKTDDKRP